LIKRLLHAPVSWMRKWFPAKGKVKEDSMKARFLVSADRVLKGLKQERSETQDMMRTFFILLTQRLPRGRQPKPEEVKAAIEQLKDVNRMAGLLVLASMPGSVITLPLLCKLANRYGIEIMPSAFQDKTTMVETLNEQQLELPMPPSDSATQSPDKPV